MSEASETTVLAFACPKCSALATAALVGPEPTGRCGECGQTSEPSEWVVGYWREAARTTDTADIPGDIIGPNDDPLADDSVIVDTRRAVLLSYTDVCITTNGSDRREFCALMMKGRVNRSQDVSRVLYLTGPDGMAALVSQLVGLAQRKGGDFANEFGTLLNRRLKELPTKGGD